MAQIRQTIAATSPASASTAAASPIASGFECCHSITVTANLRGATGGTLDVYLQTQRDGTWHDWVHFAQLAAGAAAAHYTLHLSRATAVSAPTVAGAGTSPALAANTSLGGAWGDSIRVLFVAGVSTSAGAAQTVTLHGHRD